MSQTIRAKQLEMFVWFILAFEDQYRPECYSLSFEIMSTMTYEKKSIYTIFT